MILRSNHEITDFSAAQFQYFVTNEALYPGRITRAPLSASDIVAGYTVGRITKVDASYLATGSTTLNALDFALQYDRRTSFGRLTAYAQATWEPKLRRGALNASSYDSVDSLNGPLSLRANGGVALSRGPWSFGLDAQAYSSYSVTYSFQPGSLLGGSYPIQNATNLLEQASAKIPAQAYVDAWTSLIAGGGDSTRRKPSITYRFGIKNLLDKMPPIVVPPLSASFDGIGYSPLGDPRGRRFELQITARY
ncbi:hypothetical protein [Sphingomonas glacialis]|uniref:TonB-dependent receptor n=1 Tax=Sphingomonas glacialis TaxID=658225 RepID=A0A502FRQ7_9SPHN|nr:hypothetical protein [Sphingomonas glacialis]TPG52070.1 hypothetical protein EAH76_15240 [Sphingomonas glacialis]